MKSQERKVLLRKVVMIAFLVMIVVGFTVPSLLDDGSDDRNVYEPRVCRYDSDCYLMCEDKPLIALCSQNLCQQNGCEELSGYAYNSTPVVFDLVVQINGVEQNLVNRSSSLDSFVKFSPHQVQVYSSGVPLRVILEKVNIYLNSQCVTVDQAYCNDPEKELKMAVNGEMVYSYEYYVPQEGDKINIAYS